MKASSEVDVAVASGIYMHCSGHRGLAEEATNGLIQEQYRLLPLVHAALGEGGRDGYASIASAFKVLKPLEHFSAGYATKIDPASLCRPLATTFDSHRASLPSAKYSHHAL